MGRSLASHEQLGGVGAGLEPQTHPTPAGVWSQRWVSSRLHPGTEHGSGTGGHPAVGLITVLEASRQQELQNQPLSLSVAARPTYLGDSSQRQLGGPWSWVCGLPWVTREV